MKKILRVVLPVLLVVMFICSVSYVTSAETIEDINLGATQEIASAGVPDKLLTTPVVNSVVRNGRAVTISWTASEGATRYKVFYKNGDSWKTIGYSNTNNLEFSPEFNKEYIYTVRCVDDSGNFISYYDKTGYAFTLTLDTPKVNNVEISSGDIKISWDAIEDAVAYRVFYKNGSSWKAIGDTDKTSFTWGGADYNASYLFTVRCVNNGKFESSYDKTGLGITSHIDTPYIKTINPSGASVVLSWDAVANAGKYRVFYKNGTSWKKIGDTSNTSFRVDGVTVGKEYTYTIRCITSGGKFVSSFDTKGMSYTLKLETPTLKTPVIASASTVRLSWNDVGAKKYRVFYKREGWTSWKKVADTTATSYTDKNLNKDVTYYYTVRCIDDKGNFTSDYDKTGVKVKVYLDTMPTISSVTQETDSSVDISYSEVSGAVKYKLYYKGGTQANWKIIDTTKENPYIWKFVETNEKLTYTVRATAENGDVISNYDPVGYTYVLASSKLQTPKMKSVVYAGSKLTVSWNEVARAAKYAVRVSSNNGATWSQVGTSTTTSFTYSVSPDTSRLYSVVCLDKEGNVVSDFDQMHITQLEFKAPVLMRSSTVIKFNWEKVPGATKYEIYRNYYKTSGYQYYDTVSASTTSYSDTSLEQGRGYYYKVKAICDNGVTCLSEPVKAVAGLCAPGLDVTSRLNRFNLTWNSNAYAQGYIVYYSTDNKTFKVLGRTTDTFYNSKNCRTGSVYYFRVMPYRTVGSDTVYGTYSSDYATSTDTAYGRSTGGTYVEVSLDQQHMWFYKNGKLVTETDVVTGNDDGSHNTPSGYYTVWQRQSPATLVGPTWNTTVTYWLAFTKDGCGIHDSTWRDSYGGKIYKGDGSHGCVNTPYSKVQTIYENAYIGMPVILY